MFDAIVFDFDGTLVDFVDTDTKILKLLHSKLTTETTFEKFLTTAVKEIIAFHSLVERGEADPLSMDRTRLKRTFDSLSIDWHESVTEIYRAELIRSCEPFPGVPDILHKLQKCFKLGLLTNAYDPSEQRNRIVSSRLNQYFDQILVSGEIGLYKPDPSVFCCILDRLNVVPERAVYIGDSLLHDVEGARLAGMKSVLFSKRSKINSTVADYHVYGVEELADLMRHFCELSKRSQLN
ncbi:HAD-IA family hydrolase [Vibrio astriarenae]|uniref:HAD-IA family hydrolase n=1 Tax=Vibrio astriarenae TaxID=1481923 RepID=A0A7Z2T5Y0_9VIBR|nr:HAD family hydrolase [Vibrio astriarenae]QIA65009.1 HAD-IA family hydrolase [Vibrio astriarenae]